MSYFFDTYGTPFMFIGGIVLLFILLAAYCTAADRVTRRFHLSPKTGAVFQGVAVFGAGSTLFLLMWYGPDYLNDGRVKNIYIVEKNDDVRLVVWFVREDTPAGMARVYSHRLKSYDIDTGECCARLTLSRRYRYKDYTIFGPFEQVAWGYSGQKGMAYLDVFDAESVADEKEILRRNPVLGDHVRLTQGPDGKRFDPVTLGLYVFTANGDIYRIDPDLKATHVETIDFENEVHDRSTCAVCRQMAQFIHQKVKMPGGISTVLFFASLLFCSAVVFGGFSILRSSNDMGGVRRFFVLPTETSTKLAIWCTRIYGRKTGSILISTGMGIHNATGRPEGLAQCLPVVPFFFIAHTASFSATTSYGRFPGFSRSCPGGRRIWPERRRSVRLHLLRFDVRHTWIPRQVAARCSR